MVVVVASACAREVREAEREHASQHKDTNEDKRLFSTHLGWGLWESGGATASACHQYSPVFTSVNRAGYFAVI